MTAWWERAYPGGTPDVTHPLPRPLYPPDANRHGKKASVDGPDVLAWKRSLSRGQRWLPWDPASWDDSFNNAFAHGRGSGNVGDSGVAGFQRQMDIDDSGWIGKKSWDALRYALVPEGEGFAHAGEHLIDSLAAELFQEAWDAFGGHEPAHGSGSIRTAALALATTQLGVTEEPPDSNRVKYCDWYGMTGPWCAMFVTWAYCENAAGASDSFSRGEAYSYVPYLLADARACLYGLKTVDDPVPGDLVLYNWDGGEFDHIGVFEEWTGSSSFTAIEGNTSTSNQSNGGQVMRRTRNAGAQPTVFVRAAE